MSHETTELLPCPFCGGEAYQYAPGPIEHHIACKNYKECGADIKCDTEAEAIAAWNTRAERGTLTAEQVFEVIERCVKFYEGGDYDAQEIADELNARAERTCKCVSEYAKSPFDGKTIVLHRCSECHELMRPHMLYCPNCGCKVVDA